MLTAATVSVMALLMFVVGILLCSGQTRAGARVAIAIEISATAADLDMIRATVAVALGIRAYGER